MKTSFSVHPYGFYGVLEVHKGYVVLRGKGGDKMLAAGDYWDTVRFIERATSAQLQAYIDNIIDYGEDV